MFSDCFMFVFALVLFATNWVTWGITSEVELVLQAYPSQRLPMPEEKMFFFHRFALE